MLNTFGVTIDKISHVQVLSLLILELQIYCLAVA